MVVHNVSSNDMKSGPLKKKIVYTQSIKFSDDGIPCRMTPHLEIFKKENEVLAKKAEENKKKENEKVDQKDQSKIEKDK